MDDATNTSANTSVVHSDLERMSGEPVFVESRVPARFLFEYLADGCTLEYFLYCFPSVTRERATAAIEEAGKLLVDRANTDRRRSTASSVSGSSKFA
jgi:uncharacterized protein (DUF433 family)